jgi:hypothetical protein
MNVTVNGLPCNTCGAAIRHVPGCKKETRKKLFRQEDLRAMTLVQPMATAIVKGPKRIENRIWAPPITFIGKYILIHAGNRWDEDYARAVEERWIKAPDKEHTVFGAIIGAARIVGVIWYKGKKREVVAVEDAPDDKGRVEEIFDRNVEWYMRPQFGWVLDDVFDLPAPVPCRGMHKLWKVPEHILPGVLEAIREHRL